LPSVKIGLDPTSQVEMAIETLVKPIEE